MRSDPLDVAIALDIGRGTLSKMRQNLGWAIGYNAIALPIAAGVFEPVFGLVLRPEISAVDVRVELHRRRQRGDAQAAAAAGAAGRGRPAGARAGACAGRDTLTGYRYVRMARHTNLNTTRNDWADFARWCVAHGDVAMPAAPASIVEYIAELGRGNQAASVPRRVNAIGDWHRVSGLASPTEDDRVRVAVTRAVWQQRKGPATTLPLDATELATILGALPGGLVGARDRALLLVGFVAGLRPSEIVSLDVSDLVVVGEGLAISLMRGRIVIPCGTEPDLCPVQAWQEWLAEAGLTAGPAFRSVDRTGRLGLTRLGEKAITRMVQRAAERAGLQDSRYSALSLRLGMLASNSGAARS